MLPIDPATLKRRYQQALADLKAGRVTQAEQDLRRLAAAAPKAAEIPFQLFRIAETRGDDTEAARQLDAALALRPGEPALLDAAVRFFEATDAPDKALAAHDGLIAHDPKAIKPRADKAVYLQSLGRFDEAETIFRSLLRAHPKNGELCRIFLGSKKLGPDDPLIRQMKRAWADPKLPKGERMHLGYALAKAMEDTGDDRAVFGYLDRANALQAAGYPHDPDARDAEVAAVLAAQDGPLTPIGKAVGPAPIFVTGMPRSGTTLVEQIIASHSDVVARGETAVGLRVAYQMFGTALSKTPLSALSENDLERFATACQSQAARRMPDGATAYTDKSIQSHLILGLLYRAFPHARFVVVHRDPRDIALSIYKNYFRVGTHRYANDLGHIARYIKSFQKAVDHWRGRLPDRFHEIHYEDLVTDPDAQTRALVAGVGLDWQDACLDFHKAKGQVKTLSIHQVRQPITAARARAWTRFETELAPFTAAWEAD